MRERLKHALLSLAGRRQLRHVRSCLFPRENYPWYSYPAVEFLRTLPYACQIVEYGIGHSTVFWHTQKKVVEVWGVEHNLDWYIDIAARVDSDRLKYRPEEHPYADFVQEVPSMPSLYRVVIIDGMWRALCARKTLRESVDLIVLDDANWYTVADTILTDGCLLRVPFVGLSEGVFYNKVTVVYFPRKSRFLANKNPFNNIMSMHEGTVPPNFVPL